MKALLFSFLLATATVRLQQSGEVRVGSPAPSFGGWDLEGSRVVTLASLRRSRSPLLLTFGASWCKPCNEGVPRLVALAKQHPEVRLVLIDVESDAEAARQFATRAGVTGPAVLDKFEQIARRYGLANGETLSLPRTFLLDADGVVRAIYREEGDDLDQVIAADLPAK